MSAETALARVQQLNRDWTAAHAGDPIPVAMRETVRPRRSRKPRDVPREAAVITALKNFRENGFPGTSIMDTLSFRDEELPF